MFGWLFRKNQEKNKIIDVKKLKTTQDIKVKTTLCPYCNNNFNRIVKAKSKCKKCGNTVYKRTTLGGREVVVTEKDRDKIDIAHQENFSILQTEKIVEKYFNAQLYNKDDVILELTHRFGRIPAQGDIAWYILNIELVNTLVQKRYGHYRNVKLDMYSVLYAEQNYRQSLNILMEVTYLDNSNFSLYGNRFAESKEEILPSSVNQITKLSNKLKMTQTELEETYLKICIDTQQQLRIDLEPKESLKDLKKIIRELTK